MPDQITNIVIVGGGQAGLEAAAALRNQGYEGSLTLLCEEPHQPYQRPPLSKDFLLGKQDADGLPLRAESFYEKNNIAVRTSASVTAIDRPAKQVRLASGETVAYDKLILAVGARNRLLPVKGAERVRYLRWLDEAQAIKDQLASCGAVVVIGGGFIGLEIAAAARSFGKPVTVVEALPRLMARAVSPVLSDFFRHVHEGHGVKILLGSGVQEITPDAVLLADGTSVAGDLVIAGIGVVPNVELARDAGLEIGNGIVVDEFMATSDPDIFAIGDCADHPNVFAKAGKGGRARLESVQNAVDQAKCVARAILGNATPYRDVPWFWTDQFEIRFQMVGLSDGHNQVVIRGNIDARKFSAFYFFEGRLIAVDSVNKFGDHIAARKLLTAGTKVTPEQAADESVDLKKLV